MPWLHNKNATCEYKIHLPYSNTAIVLCLKEDYFPTQDQELYLYGGIQFNTERSYNTDAWVWYKTTYLEA